MTIVDRSQTVKKDIAAIQESNAKYLRLMAGGRYADAQDVALATYSDIKGMAKSALSPNIEGTNSAGGYLVPEEFSREFAALLRKNSFAMQQCRVVRMGTNVLNVSTLAGYPSVAWTDENTAIAASAPVFGRLTLTAKKLAAIIPASNELIHDNNINYPSLINEVVAEPFATEIDTQLFSGTGTPFTGIMNTTGTITSYLGSGSGGGKTKYTDITWDDLFNLVMSTLPMKAMAGAAIYMDQHVIGDLLKRKASGSGNYFLPALNIKQELSVEDEGSYGQLGTFMGYPLYTVPPGVLIASYDGSAHASTPFGVFGNLRRTCWIGENENLRIDISRDATVESVNAFSNDLSMWRFIKRLAFGVALPQYLAVLSTDAS